MHELLGENNHNKSKEIFLPIGIQSTQIHLNYWDENYYQKFENFINKNYNKIIDMNYLLTLNKFNFFKNIVNSTVEKSLKLLRNFR